MTADPADQLALALDAIGQVIAAVPDERWTAPTPCPEWNVSEVVSHLVTGNYRFTAVMSGAPPAGPQDSWEQADLLAAYHDSAAKLLAAFRRPGALDQVVVVPIGQVPGIAALHLRITEVLVHGWDVARATGQPAAFPSDLAEQELAFSRGQLADIPADRTPFAPPQPVAEDAPAIDRLAACLGRTVTAGAPDEGSRLGAEALDGTRRPAHALDDGNRT